MENSNGLNFIKKNGALSRRDGASRREGGRGGSWRTAHTAKGRKDERTKNTPRLPPHRVVAMRGLSQSLLTADESKMNSFSRSATRQKSTSLLQKPLAELTEQEENALAEALEVHLMHSLAAANPRSSLASVSSLGGESTRVLGASDGRLADGAATAGANSPGANSHQNQNHVSQFDSPRSHHANSNSRSSVSFSRRDRLAIMQHASRAHREDDGDDVPSVSNFLRSLDHECNNEPTLASEDRLAAETSAAASSATLRERRSSSRLQSARTAACCVLQRGCCCSRKCFGRTLCRTVISKLSRLSAFVLLVGV